MVAQEGIAPTLTASLTFPLLCSTGFLCRVWAGGVTRHLRAMPTLCLTKFAYRKKIAHHGQS